METIKFILAVTGLTFIVVKSKLFLRIRIFFTQLFEKKPNNRFIWWIDSILNCAMCFSLYGAIAIYLIRLYLCNYYDITIMILASVTVTTLLVSIYDFICRK